MLIGNYLIPILFIFSIKCMAASCGPCAESCGLYFAKIKVRYQRVPDSDGEKDIMLV